MTTPISAGPFGILSIFIFAYLSIVGLFTYAIYGLSRVVAHLYNVFISAKPYDTLTFKRSYYFSTVISAAPIMLVGLQSVGTVGFNEFALVTIFVVIGCLYISKRIN